MKKEEEKFVYLLNNESPTPRDFKFHLASNEDWIKYSEKIDLDEFVDRFNNEEVNTNTDLIRII